MRAPCAYRCQAAKWTPRICTSIAQRWPACWWVLNVLDHFSRRSVGCGVFRNRPTSAEVTAALDHIMSAEQVRPKHLIVDQGAEFKCEHFEHVWCQTHDILPRFGAVGKHGSIAVVERFHRTLKELLRLTTIPEDQTTFERELGVIIDWYNEHRPHETLDGKTPNEVHYRPGRQRTAAFRATQKMATWFTLRGAAGQCGRRSRRSDHLRD